MATEWFAGVPWVDRALRAAEHRGIAREVSAIARDYREEQDGGFAVMPELDRVTGQPKDATVRVVRSGVAAIIGLPAGIVIGYAVVGADEASSRPDVATKGRGRASGRGPRLRGPRDRDELFAWLAEAGYTTQITKNHLAIVNQAGKRIGSISSTPSDHRTFANSVSTLRRITGLPLRKEQR